MRNPIISALVLCLISVFGLASTQDFVAWVIASEGKVERRDGNTVHSIVPGQEVIKSTLTTSESSRLLLKLKNNAILGLDSVTELSFENYSDSNCEIALLKGNLRLSFPKGDCKVTTPVAVITLKKSHAEIVTPNPNETFVTIYEGELALNNRQRTNELPVAISESNKFRHASISSNKSVLPLTVSPISTLGPISADQIRLAQQFEQGKPSQQQVHTKPVSAVDPLAQLKRMFQANNFKDAYIIANSLIDEWEGDPGFDFMYGVSALETGNINEAVFALERVAVNLPSNMRARADYGRALFLSQDYPRAKTEFNVVLESQPPEPVANNITRYLMAIEKAESSVDPKWFGAASFAIGFDNNINSGTSETRMDENFWGIEEVSPDSQPKEDYYAKLNANLGLRVPSSKTSGYSYGLTAYTKKYQDEEDFDLDVLGISVTTYESGPKSFMSTNLGYQYIWYGHEPLQQSYSLGLNNAYRFTQIMTSKIGYQFAFHQNEETKNKDYLVNSAQVGLGVQQGIIHHDFALTASVSDYRSAQNDHQESRTYGAQYAFNWQITQSLAQTFVFRRSTTRHLGPDPIFGSFDSDDNPRRIYRESDNASVTIISNLQVSANHSLKLTGIFSDTNSNINLYENLRKSIEVAMNYRF